MASSPLLRVPKKGTADVDFGSAIRSTITATYGEPADRYSEEITALNRARQDAVRSTAGSETTALQLLYKYFGQLELLELRFPELRVPFSWNDAFNTSKSISQLSLAYEKASVIFNTGATLSSLASEQNRSSPEGLKRSFNYYRSAAGMFTYINDNFLHAPSTDLGRELIKVLVNIMTAQATEVFLERMTEEKRSPGLKSKICSQVAAVYAGLVDEVREHVGKGIFDRSWLVLVQTKAKYFASLAQHNRAIADVAASKYGEGLARLNLAENLAKEAYRLSISYGTSFYANSAASAAATLPPEAGTSLQELCKLQQSVVAELKTSSQRDNDLIYHALVPSEASLSAIEKAANVAEPISIQEIYASPEVQKLVGTDIFIKLVPLSVIESSSMYSEEKAKILRSVGESCEVADGELTNGLEHLGLPGSLKKFRGTNGNNVQDTLADPGPQVVAWAREIRESESHRRIEGCIAELIQSRDKAFADLDYSSNELDKEQRECEQARVKFDYLFEQSPSSAHNKSWRNDIKNFKESFGQARSSDDQVLNLWNSVRSDVDLLASGDESIERLFAEQISKASSTSVESATGGPSLLDLDLPDEDNDEINQRIAAIQELQSKLTKIQKERNDVLSDLKERAHNDDISQLLLLSRKSSNVEPTLFATELEKFRPHQARIQATIQAQSSTMTTIQKEFEALTGSKKGKEIQNRWAKVERVKKDLVARFKRAIESYREIKSGVTKGTEFYRELSELVQNIRAEVTQFVTGRAAERSSMISNAEMKQRLNSNTQGSADRTNLDQTFNSMSLYSPPSSQSPSAQAPSRTSSYPSIPPSASSAYGYPSPAPPSVSRSIASPSHSTGDAYSHTAGYSSTPQLPPKPSSQQAGYSSQYRQASGGGLPPPPSQPQYHQTPLPAPPSNINYSSPSTSSSYYPPPATPHASYSTPPPPSSFSSPHAQQPYQSYSTYAPQSGVPPRPQSHQTSNFSPHNSYTSSSAPAPPSAHNQYGQPVQQQAPYGGQYNYQQSQHPSQQQYQPRY